MGLTLFDKRHPETGEGIFWARRDGRGGKNPREEGVERVVPRMVQGQPQEAGWHCGWCRPGVKWPTAKRRATLAWRVPGPFPGRAESQGLGTMRRVAWWP